MPRNVEKERKWLNENYKRLEIRVKKNKGEEFIKLLKEHGKNVNSWGNEEIEKFLKKYSKNT